MYPMYPRLCTLCHTPRNIFVRLGDQAPEKKIWGPGHHRGHIALRAMESLPLLTLLPSFFTFTFYLLPFTVLPFTFYLYPFTLIPFYTLDTFIPLYPVPLPAPLSISRALQAPSPPPPVRKFRTCATGDTAIVERLAYVAHYRYSVLSSIVVLSCRGGGLSIFLLRSKNSLFSNFFNFFPFFCFPPFFPSVLAIWPPIFSGKTQFP